jgi:hypothetical protein
MIDPSVKAVLTSRYSIRAFFFSFGGLLVLLLLSLIIISAGTSAGWFRDAATNFLGNFSATVAIFLVTYGFFVFVTPPGLRNAEVVPLSNAEIADGILDLRAGASDYWFWGRSGSHFRSVVLPWLDEVSRNERRHIRLRIVLPDPDKDENAQLYMNIRRGLGEKADVMTLGANVLATIGSVAHACGRNPFLKAEVGLCQSVPTIRYDLSDTGALITRDAKHLPALLVNSGNAYFDMFKDAVENELAQSRKVTWNTAEIADEGPEEPLSDRVLAAITGGPRLSTDLIEFARSVQKAGTHRYAR